MVGFHNKRIYTEGDNPWCKTCLNGERIVGEKIFKDGAYVCYCGGIPDNDRCSGYHKMDKKKKNNTPDKPREEEE